MRMVILATPLEMLEATLAERRLGVEYRTSRTCPRWVLRTCLAHTEAVQAMLIRRHRGHIILLCPLMGQRTRMTLSLVW